MSDSSPSSYEVQVAAATEAGLGPFTPLEKTSLHRFVLSNSAPFLQSVGFIMLVVVVALTGLVVMFIVVLVWRRHLRTNNARKYQCELWFLLAQGFRGGSVGVSVLRMSMGVALSFCGRDSRFAVGITLGCCRHISRLLWVWLSVAVGITLGCCGCGSRLWL